MVAGHRHVVRPVIDTAVLAIHGDLSPVDSDKFHVVPDFNRECEFGSGLHVPGFDSKTRGDSDHFTNGEPDLPEPNRKLSSPPGYTKTLVSSIGPYDFEGIVLRVP